MFPTIVNANVAHVEAGRRLAQAKQNKHNKQKSCCGYRYVSERIDAIPRAGIKDKDEYEMPNAKREAP
jgi:hypothetical protein